MKLSRDMRDALVFLDRHDGVVGISEFHTEVGPLTARALFRRGLVSVDLSRVHVNLTDRGLAAVVEAHRAYDEAAPASSKEGGRHE